MAKYYVVCDDDCRYESLTREQILAAIEQALEQGYVSDPDDAVFSKVKEVNSNGAVQIWVGNESEFNAIENLPDISRSFVRAGSNGILYICSDDSLAVDIENHLSNQNNPHNVTLRQLTGRDSLGADFSTEETNTGLKWIDGRTVYTKMVVIENTTTTVKVTETDIVAALAWLDLTACFVLDKGNTYHPGFLNSSMSQIHLALAGVDDAGKVSVTTKTALAGATIYLKVMYVKTNDAGTLDSGRLGGFILS